MDTKMLGAIVIIIVVAAGVGAVVLLGPTLFGGTPRVAIVFATGGLGDKSFNDGCYEGAVRARNEFGVAFTYVEPTQISEYEGYLRTYAQHAGRAPYDVIISIGFDQADALTKVANETPNQRFAIVDMVVPLPNVSSLVFAENEGSALVGAIAGLMTKTDKVGFIGGMDIDLINKFAGGFVFGANWTKPGVNYTIGYTGNWVDTATGKALADVMYNAGTDIIFAAAGRSGLGVFESAKEKTDKYVIGVDSPQMYLGCADPSNPAPPTVCLTSMLKRVDVAVYETIKDAIQGNFHGGIRVFDLENGGLGYEVNAALRPLPSNVTAIVEDLKAAIINGSITVPSTKYWLP
ncbi:MAG: BMP family ABC transporter substrate-binding protein [Candidatus Thorarchaeota archaeon]|nr:BMP family ABC transporter substrate-binding protein [Candidatus Thorarchaeota archaeon]